MLRNTTTDLSITNVLLFRLVELDRNKNFESNTIGF